MEPFFFQITDESPQGGHYTATGATAGPWDGHLQHGGPPNALLVRAAERFVAAHTGRADLVALRLAAEFTGPVPVGDVEVEVRPVRIARSAALVDVQLRADGRDCLHARTWLVRHADGMPHGVAGGPRGGHSAELPDLPGELPGLSDGWSFGYADHVEWRFVSGQAPAPGPAVVWTRPRVPLVAGEIPSGLQRAALLADSASGVSAELSWAEWAFRNVDLDVHLSRPMAGEWLLLDAVTQLGGAGAALAKSTLSDRDGVLGAGLQTLVVQRTAP